MLKKFLNGIYIAARVAQMVFKIGILPREVPENLSAKKYYELGIKYKLAGWIAQSKQSLKLSVELDPDGIGKNADIYLKAYLPLHDIPEEAVMENIWVVNQSLVDKPGAEKMYRDLIEQYPNFEWPCGNLGHQYIEQGRFAEAKEVLNTALTINPHYANGLIHLAAVHMKENDGPVVDKLLREVLIIDPEFKSNILENYPDLVKRLKTLKNG